MCLHVTVQMMTPLYQAAQSGDPDRPEWPPHPARLFSATVAHADLSDAAQWAALQWWERQQPPVITVPARTARPDHPRCAWVVSHKTDPDGRHARYPGRTAGGQMRTWAHTAVDGDRLVFTWPQEPPAHTARLLDAMVRRIPYLGRATGAVVVDAWCGPEIEPDPAAAQPLERWVPATGPGTPGAAAVRVPFPGYLQALEDAFEQDQGAWSTASTIPYQRTSTLPEPEPASVNGPFADVIAFSLAPGVTLDPRATMDLTGALRGKLLGVLRTMGHTDDQLTSIHGHRDRAADGRPVAYLALPFVGHPHADGLVRGLALALPAGMPAGERKALLAAVFHHDGGLSTIPVRSLGTTLALRRVMLGERRERRTVLPDAWTADSTTWASATPVVLDHYPKAHDPYWAKALVATCAKAGLPSPVEMRISRHEPLLAGSHDVGFYHRRRTPGYTPTPPACHVVLTFPEPVRGPVLLGRGKDFGLGLCWPHPEPR
ncbi:type I-U CRISPR-associated protein Csb2 [Kitasatospora sp. NPDC058046]|uniref:type I-G CRISPR-associated protein Csb2 n=1 Tax=Kitasatospora sp. NPDC058046 TaxID=3346312 RepID=UPI0036D77421